MSRGRKKLPAAEKVDVRLNHHAIAADSAAVDGEHARKLARIEEQYGDGDLYSRDTCVAKARFHLNSSAEALLEAGRQLIRIKEHEPHGDFLHALEQLGTHPRMAQRVMQAAAKFTTPANATLASHLGRSKMLELTIEDEETIDSFAKGGTLYGLMLDDVDRMSPTELRAKLRNERKKRKEDQETHERLLVDKNKKLDEYTRLRSDIPAQILKLRQDVITATGEIIAGINKLTRIRLDVHDVPGFAEHRDEIVGAVGVTMLQSIWQAQAWLTEESNWADHDFGGSRIEIRATSERGPDLSPDEIQNLKNAGIEEAVRVTGAVFEEG